MLTRNIPAPEVTVGSVWFMGGKHQEVVERVNLVSDEIGTPGTIPHVRLAVLDTEGKQTKPMPFLVAAWRVLKYGMPSQAFQRP
jgi:hypothetical protein